MKTLSFEKFSQSKMSEQLSSKISGGGWICNGTFTMNGVRYYDCINEKTGEHACGLTHDQMDALCMK